MIPRLPTTCEGVDKLLAGGIEQGTVSLVYGEAGSGKKARTNATPWKRGKPRKRLGSI